MNHDELNRKLDALWRPWTDGPKYLLATPDSPQPILDRADKVGNAADLLKWAHEFPYKVGTVFVATEDGLIYNIKEMRPDLDVRELNYLF